MPLQIGLSATFDIEIGPADTAVAVGSGDLPVLGTPRVIALMEAATVRVVVDHLAPGETSVGVEVVVAHHRASLVGARITVAATLTELDDRRLCFSVTAHENGALVADGTVRRVVVDSARFMKRARE